MDDTFECLQDINETIKCNQIDDARNKVIKLLAKFETASEPFPAALNHFIREVGLSPYLNVDNASWQERLLYESFKVNIGDGKATLHRDQSLLLKKLIGGQDVAVSAPTSFGKSFVIDAFIAIKKPTNVVIIVLFWSTPTGHISKLIFVLDR